MAIAAIACLAVGPGCAPDARVAPVSGVITLDGQPLEGAFITTQPIRSGEALDAGVGSFGKTDAEGRYALELVTPPQPGAIVGEHVVRIKLQSAKYVAGREDAPMVERSKLPRSAQDGSLRLVAPPEGTATADFHFERAR